MAHAKEEVSRLTDAELVLRLERLVQADRALSAKLLVHLGELDERKLFLARGYSSTHDYCRHALRMSEAEAYLRTHAARVGRRFPLVVERLSAGTVHLSAIKLLSPFLTEDNHVQLLDRVRGRTKREIEVLVADLSPKPDVPARMRKLPEARKPAPQVSSAVPATSTIQVITASPPATPQVPVPQASGSADASVAVQEITNVTGQGGPRIGPEDRQRSTGRSQQSREAAPSRSFALQSPRPRASCTPLGLGRFKLELTLGQEVRDQLDQLKELLRHQNPSGDLASIVERAVRELHERTMKRRFAAKMDAPARRSFRKPKVETHRAQLHPAEQVAQHQEQKDKAKGNSRYIPRGVLREVHTRDGEQCTFVSSDGRRCTERGFLEVHHHNTTFARGGEATVDNLRIACRAHNQFWAAQDYGQSFMKNKLHEVAPRKGDEVHL